jgi:hypothetical protein
VDRPDAALRDALMNADYAALSARPSTPQAQRLVDEVFAQVVADRLEGRKGGYKATKQKMLIASMGFIGDLLLSAGNSHGWVYRSLHKENFTGQDVSYHSFKRVLDRFKQLDLIEHKEGYRQLAGFDGGPKVAVRSRASRFRATPKLLDLAAECGVPVDQAKHHFIVALPEHPLVKKATSTWDPYGHKERGRNLKFASTEKTEKLEADVVELNKFLDRFQLRGGVHRGYIRVFNCGDDLDFDWNFGGRLYSQGGEEDNYQRLSPDKRLQMTIDGEPVCEIDIKASYLTIFLAWHDQHVEGDPYAIPGLPRDVVKNFFVVSWGNDGRTGRWSRKMINEYHEETGRKLGSDYPIKAVGEKVRTAYPVVQSIAQHRHIWAKLMWIESVAMLTTMQRLMREHEVPGFSIHDSLIIPASKQELAKELLAKQYCWVTQVQPQLEVKVHTTNMISGGFQ